MRFFLALAALVIQAQTLPPPFPREGATKVLDNDQIVVWDVAWLQRAYPTHHHIYDYAGVYYTSGDRVIVSQEGSRRPTHTTAWDTFFIRRGVTHSEEGASAEPLRAVFVEFKEPAPRSAAGGESKADAVSEGLGKKIRESDRLVIWEYLRDPEAQSGARRHAMDAVVVAFTNLKPRVTFVPKGTTNDGDAYAGADRVYSFELK
jgi:hypothetical protein